MEVLQLLISGISQGCVYGLIALGFVLIYKATEMVNFAQGDLMMLGAFIAYTFLNVAVLMITIGLGFVLRAVAGIVWGSEPKSIASPLAGGVLRFGDLAIGYQNLAIVGGTIVLCLFLFGFFRFTRLGVAMQAASQNQLAAYYCGIPVKRVFSIVWALSAAIAAMAGMLVAPITLVDPMMGFIGIKAFAAAIVGGFGSLQGAMAGGLLIGIVEQFAGLYLPTGFADTSAYVILLLMLFIRPEGLFATMQRKKV
jgi:branched-chain amino acid transport system permease protein